GGPPRQPRVILRPWPMIDLGPSDEVPRVVGESNSVFLPSLRLPSLSTDLPGFHCRTPAWVPPNPSPTLIPSVNRMALHPTNLLFVNVPAPAGEPDCPVPTGVSVHPPGSWILLFGAPRITCSLRTLFPPTYLPR